MTTQTGYADQVANYLGDQFPQGVNQLILQAVQQQWAPDQLKAAIFQSKFFQDAYPGYFSPDGAPRFSNVAQYHATNRQFRRIAQTYGYTWDRTRFARAMSQEISPSEFQQRLETVHHIDTILKDQPEVFAGFNAELKALGMKQLNQEGFYKFSIGDLEQNFADVYEAAHLKSAGVDISNAQAMKVAKLTEGGGPGQGGGIDPNAITSLKPDISPEMRQSGVSQFRLAKALAGVDKSGNVLNTIRALQAQRRALGVQVGSSRLGRTDQGTLGVVGVGSGVGTAD